jgi:hypothetical protein
MTVCLSSRYCADHYPEPHEPHPVSNSAQRRKIDACEALVGGRAQLLPLVHGYGPDSDFHRRLAVVATSQAQGAWINRYGYLSDAKIASIRDLLGGTAMPDEVAKL